MTRNFNAKKVEMQFDEYFKLNNQYQEISISPTQERLPEFKISSKKLIIDFKDSLQKNTTYVINFGKSIQDVNESNILKNFTYVFSTGPHIDSLSVSGSVTNTETQEKEKDATVMLFPLKQDTAFFGKKKPMIFTTTDSSGNFSLGNLHDGDYRIYALKEPSPDRIYNSDKELIAFSKDPIHLTKDTSGISLRLFKQVPDKFRIAEKRFDQDGKLLFVFNRPLKDPSVKITYPPNLDDQKIVDFSKNKDTALVYMRNMDFDSIRVAFAEQQKPLDTTYLRKGRKETFTRAIAFRYNLDQDNRLKPGNDLQLTSNLPIETFEQSLIVLAEDSTQATFIIQKDPNNPKLFKLKSRWKQDAIYTLTINDNAFTDIYGDKSKKTIKKFQLNKPENYGTLSIKLNVPDTSKAYIAEVINQSKSIVKTQLFSKNSTLIMKDFPTGKYRIRIIYDANRNGIWDSGNVKKALQPENIWLYNKDISLRANWDTEETVDIPREPVTP
ncbi:Ig-like domain-containing protein [Mucilaginibacter sp. RS28]|uniref:Ig-like domain-containing protein n=2 Tax=Mucilaginibacter straminoryzae TaxID=2932774 RepID=A0A9X1X8B9_9SPHI|nr:Ig-like domain-containing protein [Mucilaginibacter straminoryzae]